ncbi:MAG: PTS sugar transporter subunit IIC [Sarcina sp.]
MKFMEKLGDWLEKHVMPIASVVGGQRHLAALRDGFIATLAVNMIGAMCSLFNNVLIRSWSLIGEKLNGIEGYANNVQPILSKYIEPVLLRVNFGTLAIITVFLVITISYNLAKSYDIDGIGAAVSSTAAYFVVLAISRVTEGADATGAVDAAGKAIMLKVKTDGALIPFSDLGATAMFAGILVALIATEIFVKVTKAGWTIKMPEQVPPAVSKAFSAILPATFAIITFAIISVIFTDFVGTSFKDWIEQTIQSPLMKLGQSPITYVFMILIAQILWFFGIHGSNIIDPAMNTMYKPPLFENIAAYNAGGADAVQHVLTRNFLDVYAQHGGSGATFGLVIAIYLFSKRQEYKELAKLATAPGLFQINEPVIFGLPMVLNPMMFIPFVLTPAICVSIAYFFTAVVPFAAKISAETPWTTPPILSAFLATNGDWKAAVLAAGTFLLSILIYAPFVIAANRMGDEN